jgi:actin-like ATPase involved in cell morphogenesis
LFSPFRRDIAIDLGTANILAYVRGRGIVLDEPMAAALGAIGTTACVTRRRSAIHTLVVRQR